ncbi:hypothetical protein [Gryllotalpicola koreensis]|uniref:YD repeat-containing protein n=1 Tax=Gryllotalpicola koreensis TaxID=993086 RepID=A0ABP8A3A9_9MICO
MTAFPPEVITCNLVVGKWFNLAGPVGGKVAVRPSRNLVWAATGDSLLDQTISVTADQFGAASVSVPVVDQPGWVDADDPRQAVTGWYYVVTAYPSGGTPWAKPVSPVTGQESIDVEMQPNGSAQPPQMVTPPAVTSVNGSTGAVTVEGMTDAGLTAIAADPDSAFAAQQKATFVAVLPNVGSLSYDGSGNVIEDQDGTTYTYNGDGTVATITKGGVTRTLTYNTDGTIASVA